MMSAKANFTWLLQIAGAALVVLISTSCKDVPFYADGSATLVLATSKTFLMPGGESAQITVTGYSSTWDALRDGTQVTFSTTLGSIPAAVELHDGRAVVTFVSGSERGQAKITARSGQAVADVTINIGYSQDAKITLKATPTSLPSAGGQVRIQVDVFDIHGNPFAKIPVSFETTSGHFDKAQKPTDDQGTVVNTLYTKETADVTARALGQATAPFTIEVAANVVPTAAMTFWPENPKVEESVTFDGSGSTDSDGKVEQYYWTFSDGYKAQGVQVHHAFLRSGSVTANLRVVDDREASSATETKTLTVGPNLPPTASFTVSPSTALVGQRVRFDGSMSSDPDGKVKKWEWDFGDGKASSGEIVMHAYDYPGTFAPNLVVTDDDGLKDSEVGSVTVGANVAPTANFTYITASDGGGLKIYFDSSSSTDSDGYVVSYNWDFSDGSSPVSTSSTNVTHTFPEKKTYSVKLVVTDNYGATGQVVKDVTIQ